MDAPTNGELKAMFDGLKEHVTDAVFNAKQQLTESINRVEVQAIKTNGRVTWLEKCAYILIGGGLIISSMVIPLVIYVWNQSQNRDAAISQAVDEAFDQWQVQTDQNTGTSPAPVSE